MCWGRGTWGRRPPPSSRGSRRGPSPWAHWPWPEPCAHARSRLPGPRGGGQVCRSVSFAPVGQWGGRVPREELVGGGDGRFSLSRGAGGEGGTHAQARLLSQGPGARPRPSAGPQGRGRGGGPGRRRADGGRETAGQGRGGARAAEGTGAPHRRGRREGAHTPPRGRVRLLGTGLLSAALSSPVSRRQRPNRFFSAG